jgi:hypothetical protein
MASSTPGASHQLPLTAPFLSADHVFRVTLRSTAFLVGPKQQCQNMAHPHRLAATLLYLCMMVRAACNAVHHRTPY